MSHASALLMPSSAMAFHKEPHWVPAKPKRFAWTIGIVLIVTCFICWRIGWENGFKQKYEARYQVIDVDEAMDCSVLDLTDLSDYPLECICPSLA